MSVRTKNIAVVVLAALMLCAASGCSTYAHKVSKIRTAYYAGQLEQAHKMVDEGLKHGSGDADRNRKASEVKGDGSEARGYAYQSATEGG